MSMVKYMMLIKKRNMYVRILFAQMDAILSETDWVRNDKWTVLMEAASFGQAEVAICDIILRYFNKTPPGSLSSPRAPRPGTRGSERPRPDGGRGCHGSGASPGWWGYIYVWDMCYVVWKVSIFWDHQRIHFF